MGLMKTRRVQLEGPAAETSVCGPAGPKQTVRVCMRTTGKPGPQLLSHEDVCKYMRGAEMADRESLYVIHADVRRQVIGLEEVAKGSLSSVQVHPREVFKAAILNNASSMIVVHNHPSGDATPSREDIELTRRLVDAGRMLGIPLEDHVIVAPGRDCKSLRALNLVSFDGSEQLSGHNSTRKAKAKKSEKD